MGGTLGKALAFLVTLLCVSGPTSAGQMADRVKLRVRPGWEGFVLSGRLVARKLAADDAALFRLGTRYEIRLATNGDAIGTAGGKPVVTAEGTGLAASSSRQLLLRCHEGKASVFLDGRRTLMFDVDLSAIAELTFASTSAAISLAEPRLQGLAPIIFDDDFMRMEGEGSVWEPVTGDWSLLRIPNPELSADAFRYTGKGEGALAAAGHWFWHDYLVRAACKFGNEQSAIGVVFYLRDAHNYHALQWHCSPPELRLVRVRAGKEYVLAKRAAVPDTRQWYELLVAVSDRAVRAFVDGRNVFRVQDDHLCSGKIGLWASSSAGNRYDDLAVRSLNLSEAALADASYSALAEPLHVRHAYVSEDFQSDAFMIGWSRRGGAWVLCGPDGTPAPRPAERKGVPIEQLWAKLDPSLPHVYWNSAWSFGNASLRWERASTEDGVPPLPKQWQVALALCTDGENLDSGYSARLMPEAGGKLRAVLLRQGKSVCDQTVAASEIKSLLVTKGGSAISVLLNASKLFEYTDPKPLTQGRAAFVAEGVTVIPDELSVTEDNVFDYTFHRAPTDWRVSTGNWSITSRWICAPRFTWFAGESDQVALLWNKRSFPGDVCVEVYASIKMGFGMHGGYGHVGDVNVSICGDGRNLENAYNFVYGGWDNTKCVILRGSKVVAETEEVTFPKSKGYWHNRWYHVKAERVGNEVRFYLGHEKILSFTDPRPLRGTHVALWTFRGSIITPRVSIHYEKGGELDTKLAVPARPHTEPAIAITSSTHPSIQNDFEHGPGTWRNRSGEQGGAPVVASDGSRQGRFLSVVNTHAGGDFAVSAFADEFDVTRYPVLSFAYRFPPSAKVDLCFTANGKKRAISLACPKEPRPVVGRVLISTDRNWHTAKIDLLDALRPHYPDSETITVSDLHFANWDTTDYVICGLGGNPAGCRYDIDDFFVGAAGGRTASFTWQPSKKGSRFVGYSVSLDRQPLTVPAAKVTTRASKASFDGLAPGDWYLHVRGQDEQGHWTQPVHHHFLVDTEPPAFSAPSPAPGRASGESLLTIRLHDQGGSTVNPAAVALELNDVTYSPDSPGFFYGPQSHTLYMDLNRTSGFEEGAEIKAGVVAADRVGNRSVPFKWSWQFRRTDDRHPPEIRVVQGEPPLFFHDFETSTHSWRADEESPGTLFHFDRSTSSSGRCSLRVVNRSKGGELRCLVWRKSFSAYKYPGLSFDYRIAEGQRVSLALLLETGWHCVRFTDNKPRWPSVGSLAPVSADEEWHTAELDLMTALRAAGLADCPIVYAIGFEAGPSRVGREFLVTETVFNIGRFQVSAVINAAKGAALRWQASDMSGIEGYNFALDSSPATELGETIRGRDNSVRIDQLASGTHWFHVRARDRAGKWGPVRHQRLYVRNVIDAEPPKVVSISPQNGERVATSQIKTKLSDDVAGVDPESVVLAVAGKQYRVTDAALQYRQGTLAWDASTIAPDKPAFADQQKVACSLSLADYVGNRSAEPTAWTWTMDYTQDKVAPSPPRVLYTPSDRLFQDEFEESLGEWSSRRGGWARLSEREPFFGSGCVEFGGFATFIRTTPYDVTRYPLIAFDYHFPERTQTNLMLRIDNNNYEAVFTKPRCKGSNRPIGEIPGGLTDGEWHHVELNLLELLKPHLPDHDQIIVQHLATITNGIRDQYIDNFTVFSPRGRSARFRWQPPYDCTGLRGYSYVLDQVPGTVPPPEVNTATTGLTLKDLSPGPWSLHVRAQDGAGNWGETAHYPIMVEE